MGRKLVRSRTESIAGNMLDAIEKCVGQALNEFDVVSRPVVVFMAWAGDRPLTQESLDGLQVVVSRAAGAGALYVSQFLTFKNEEAAMMAEKSNP